MVHGTDEVVFVFDGNILPHRVVGLDEVEIHPMEEILPALQQSVRLSQKGPHQLTRGGVAGVDDEGQLFYLLALPGLQRLDEGQVAVDRQAVGVKVQIELVRVEVDFLPGDAEPAQKVAVAAAAAVCGFDLLPHGVRALTGLFVPELQLCLHPLADFLPGLPGQRGGHLLGLFGGIFGPEAVVVGVEFFFQLAENAGSLPHQPAVDGSCSSHFFLRDDLLIGVLAHPRQGALDALAAKTVDDVLHRNVTRKVPQAFVPLSAQPEMAEDAVEHRVEVEPVEIFGVLLVEPQQGAGLVAEDGPIRRQHTAPLVGGGRQGREGLV